MFQLSNEYFRDSRIYHFGDRTTRSIPIEDDYCLEYSYFNDNYYVQVVRRAANDNYYWVVASGHGNNLDKAINRFLDDGIDDKIVCDAIVKYIKVV